jgi:multiple sugar transport system substrate-binding protein
MKKNATITTLSALAVLAIVTGCGGKPSGDAKQSADAPVKPVVNTTPATLKLYLSNSSLSDQDVKTLVEEPVKKVYPHISVEIVRNAKGATIEELLATGQTPDIFYTNIADIGKYKRYGLLSDITPLLKANGVDLSRFDPQMLAGASSEQGEIYGLPFFAHFNATYYNKGIFDKFGVSYPQDGMTWDQVIELAKKVSRVESGVTYKGLDPDTIARLAMTQSLTLVDAKTNKAAINSDGWRNIFTLAKEIWTIPNNTPEKLNSFNARNWFMNDQNVAMLPYNNLLNIGLEDATKKGLNWDLAQYPSFKEKPNVSAYVDAQLFSISQTSKYREQAAQLLSIVTSDEVQMKSARTTARFTSLKNPALKEALGADMPFLQGKNLKSIFKSTMPAAPAFSSYDSSDVRNISFKSFEEYMKGKDLNTVLREAEEKINNWRQ